MHSDRGHLTYAGALWLAKLHIQEFKVSLQSRRKIGHTVTIVKINTRKAASE